MATIPLQLTFRCDASAACAVIEELSQLLVDAPDAFREGLLCLTDRFVDLVSIDHDSLSASGANEISIGIKPSEIMNRVLATARAGDFDLAVFDRHDFSSVGCVATTNEDPVSAVSQDAAGTGPQYPQSSVTLSEGVDCERGNEYGSRDEPVHEQPGFLHELSQCEREQGGAENREARVREPEEDVANSFELNAGHVPTLSNEEGEPELLKTLTIAESASPPADNEAVAVPAGWGTSSDTATVAANSDPLDIPDFLRRAHIKPEQTSPVILNENKNVQETQQ